jgi:hypothetical protein
VNRSTPAVDGDVVDLDAVLGEEFFDVAVGQAEAQVPGDRDDDHLGWTGSRRGWSAEGAVSAPSRLTYL